MTGIWPNPIAVEPRDGFCIWVRYEDGVEGEVDVSHLAKMPIFKAWSNREFFESVHINDFGAISWGFPEGDDMELDIAPETGYARLLGITREDMEAMPDYESFREAVIEAKMKREITVSAGN